MASSPYILNGDVLTAENVFFSTGERDIVTGGTLTARKGSITGLLGKNGSGKSTMLQCIFGTRVATECDVFVNGVRTALPYAVPGLINYLPQGPFIPGGMRVKAVLDHYGVHAGAILSHFPLFEAYLDSPVQELSGGTERLLGVVMILLAPTRFSILDEPFTHIMPLHVEVLQKLILAQKKQKGIVVTDHMYRHLLSISDNLYFVKEGKTILIRHPEDLVLHGYLSALPDVP